VFSSMKFLLLKLARNYGQMVRVPLKSYFRSYYEAE
jgi:hypothetical protein